MAGAYVGGEDLLVLVEDLDYPLDEGGLDLPRVHEHQLHLEGH